MNTTGAELATQERATILERALDLYGNGVPWRKVARAVGVPKSTLRDWLEAEGESVTDRLARARARKAEHHAEAGLQALKAVNTRTKYARDEISRADKVAAQHRWLASCLDQRWNPQQRVDVNARVQAVCAYVGLKAVVLEDEGDDRSREALALVLGADEVSRPDREVTPGTPGPPAEPGS